MVKKSAAQAAQSHEMKFYGLNACSALWQNRAADIIRVYVAEPRMKEFGALLKWCAKQKKAYHVLSTAELERVAASVHHEGVVILAREPRWLDDATLAERIEGMKGSVPLLYLDGVQNPHNIGSITRVAAHFGAPIIMGRSGQLPRLTPSGARIAQGGVEHVTFASLKDPEGAFKMLRQHGFKLVATSSHGSDSLFADTLPERAIIAFGGETTGASARLLANADFNIKIPGTGTVESLNVSVASGLLLGEYWRLHHQGR